jgi:hypothetical protein
MLTAYGRPVCPLSGLAPTGVGSAAHRTGSHDRSPSMGAPGIAPSQHLSIAHTRRTRASALWNLEHTAGAPAPRAGFAIRFREPGYRALRRDAARFDVEKQKSRSEARTPDVYLVARWMSDAGVKDRVLQVTATQSAVLRSFYFIAHRGSVLRPRTGTARLRRGYGGGTASAVGRSSTCPFRPDGVRSGGGGLFFDLTAPEVLAGFARAMISRSGRSLTKADVRGRCCRAPRGVSVPKIRAMRPVGVRALSRRSSPPSSPRLATCVRTNRPHRWPEPAAGGAAASSRCSSRRLVIFNYGCGGSVLPSKGSSASPRAFRRSRSCTVRPDSRVYRDAATMPNASRDGARTPFRPWEVDIWSTSAIWNRLLVCARVISCRTDSASFRVCGTSAS